MIYLLASFILLATINSHDCIETYVSNIGREEWSDLKSLSSMLKIIELLVLALNIPLQIVLYLYTRKLMRRTLNYFYDQTQYEIFLCMISNIIYHCWICFSKVKNQHSIDEYLFIYRHTTTVNESYFITIWWENFAQVVSLCIFAIQTTKFINLKNYLQVLMFKYGVYEHFESMSYLITKTWFSSKDLYT